MLCDMLMFVVLSPVDFAITATCNLRSDHSVHISTFRQTYLYHRYYDVFCHTSNLNLQLLPIKGFIRICLRSAAGEIIFLNEKKVTQSESIGSP